jgi:hypothetical protein
MSDAATAIMRGITQAVGAHLAEVHAEFEAFLAECVALTPLEYRHRIILIERGPRFSRDADRMSYDERGNLIWPPYDLGLAVASMLPNRGPSAILALVDEYENEHGEITAEEIAALPWWD